ncbi:MAG TPA: AAA family ATPase [Flavobacteriaceae bacterium]|nr:AAA family ATPase [Flavobacteriaceae bacterium]HIP27384.1 AAA family ATPase [Flavobacteriaceae bacterium]
MEKLVQKFYEKYANTQLTLIRNFINEIDWSNQLIGIKGSRGVGKTTLILQYIKQHFKANKEVLYISLDDLYFTTHLLYDLANTFYKKGGLFLAIDEVHRYKNWAIEIKNIYDDMPNLKIVFTGSSLLHIQNAKADLSRRAVIYELSGLSFREFIQFETGKELPIYDLNTILKNHIEIAIELKKFKTLTFFDDYLNYGYYPFYKENKTIFHQKLSEVILTILEVDITQFAEIKTTNIIYLKKLLQIISVSVPFKPNMNSLSQRTGITVNTMKNYIKLLSDAELLQLLYVPNKSLNSLNKPEKLYLNNTNLMYNQSASQVNIGNIRETFFFNQLNNKHKVKASKKADFLVLDKYTFEIGGKSKKKTQIKGLENAFIVKDTIEIGSDNIIPLWLFGFMY